MTVFSNLRGTSEINFRIGISGPTIYTGSDDPNVTGPTPIDAYGIGDVYFRSGSTGNPWFYNGTDWSQVVATSSGGTIVGGNTTIGGDLTVTGQGLFANGSTAAPSIAFLSDTDTGIYRKGTNEIGFVTDGVERFYINDADSLRGANLQLRGGAGNASDPTYAFDGDGNTGMYNAGPNSIGFSTGSTTALVLDNGANATFASSVVVQGDLTVNGTTTTVNSANLAVTDNIVTLNNGESGAGVSLGTAGVEIDRGTLPSATALFNESFDEWQIGITGSPVIAVRQPDGTRAGLEVLTTDAFRPPVGTTAQRPSSPTNGMFRYNTTLNTMESYVNGTWESVPSAPAGNVFLLDTNNLSELTNVATARTNLGLVAGGTGDIWVEKAGDTMSGTLNMGNNRITNVANPTTADHVGDRGYNDGRYLLEGNNLSDLTNATTARINLGLVSGGAGDIWVEKSGDTMTGNLTMSGSAEVRISNGAENNPSLTFASDQDTGFYRAAANAIGFTTNNFRTAQLSPNSFFVFGNNTSSSVNIRRGGALTTTSTLGLLDFEGQNSGGTTVTYARISGIADTVTAGGEEGRIDFATRESGAFTTTMRLQDGRLRLQNSSAGSPMFSRLSDTNTGIHLPSNDTIELTTAGTFRTRITNQDVQLNTGVDLYFNNNALVSNSGVGPGGDHATSSNVDHIWHNDTTNTWHFVSDGAYKANGNATLQGTAVAALYADLAERYEADAEYPEGTILVIGGEKEVTTTDKAAHHSVAGIVSLYPAFKMNNTDDHQSPLWPYVALAGRVPCRVIGKVAKGDRLGTSDTQGVAMSLETSLVAPGAVVGIAMEDYDDTKEGIIEVMVRSA